MRILSVLAIAALLLSPSAVHASKEAKQSFTQDFYNATAALYSQDFLGRTTFLCTATAFEKTATGYHLLTAKHCTASDPNAYFVVFDEDSLSPYHRATVLFEAGDADVAVLDVVTDLSVPVIPLGDEKLEAVGAPVINVAQPMNLGKLLFHGFIATKRLVPRMDDDQDSLGLQLPAAGGSSGSAIVSEGQHAIIGVLVSIFIPKNGGSVLTVAVPVSQVRQAIQDFKDGKVTKREAAPSLGGLFDLFKKK